MLPLLILLAAVAASKASSSPSSAPPDPAPSSAKRAAQALWVFLTRTGRFGSATDRVPQVAAAQRLLMVKADGIVGPVTRAAAAAVGVTLPMKPTSSTRPSSLTIEHPADSQASSEEQAAIDAAVSQAIREGMPQPIDANPEYAAPSSSSSALEPPPPSAELVQQASSAAKEAASNLLAFLIKTRRYGTQKDRPEEVKSAQRALGVPDDGIVGPATRAAAAKLGVAIPPRGK